MIKLKGISKNYNGLQVFENFNLDILENKINVILGESGAGKTTLLNIISGITDFDGEIENKPNSVSMVFRENRLIPNLTVKENLLLIDKDIDVYGALSSVSLQDKINNYPKTLSAGQARRLSILRALVKKSDVLLMDEPFINLDIALKFKLIERIKQEKRTVILVTHDIKEAVLIADKIVVISNGKKIKEFNENIKDAEQEVFNTMISLKNFDKTSL